MGNGIMYVVYVVSILGIGILAFLAGRKLSKAPKGRQKTTTFLLKSIQAIAELAILEYITEGVTDIKEKRAALSLFGGREGY